MKTRNTLPLLCFLLALQPIISKATETISDAEHPENFKPAFYVTPRSISACREGKGPLRYIIDGKAKAESDFRNVSDSDIIYKGVIQAYREGKLGPIMVVCTLTGQNDKVRRERRMLILNGSVLERPLVEKDFRSSKSVSIKSLGPAEVKRLFGIKNNKGAITIKTT